MMATDRKFYCPHNPYTDAPQTIGHSVTISAPHMVRMNLVNHSKGIRLIYFLSSACTRT